LEDGLKLIQLLEIISGDSITGYDKKPKLRVQKCINIGLALKVQLLLSALLLLFAKNA